MKTINPPLIAACLCFSTGIGLGFVLPAPLRWLNYTLFVCLLLFLGSFIYSKKQDSNPVPFSICTGFLFLVFGFFTTKIHLPKHTENHYSHRIEKLTKPRSSHLIKGHIHTFLGSSKYTERYLLQLTQIDGKNTVGKVLLYRKKTAKPVLQIDAKLTAYGAFRAIAPPKNPFQFDYQRYLQHKAVFLSFSMQKNAYFTRVPTTKSLNGYAAEIRKNTTEMLQENGFSADQLAMLEALLLGQTTHISDETYTNFTAAGVIHVLSVSGLHVGFVLLLLHFLLRPLKNLPKGKMMQLSLSICGLWAFALLAGFSPPVVRSASMFSLVAIGMQYGRNSPLLNILFFSLFITLLAAPNLILDIGYQLSYLAVFSIVIFFPFFKKGYQARFWIDRILWESFCLSLAAQIGVLPLTLFYFHQFSGISFLANLLVVPYVGFLLGFGILAIGLGFVDMLPVFLTPLLGGAIDGLQLFVGWCAAQEAFIFSQIPFSKMQLCAGFVLLLSAVLLLGKYTYKKLICFGGALLLFLGSILYVSFQKNKVERFIIFHKTRKTMLGFQQRKVLQVAHNLTQEELKKGHVLKDYCAGMWIDTLQTQALQNLYLSHHKKLLIVDSSGVYQLDACKNSFVLLRNSPRINLNRLIETLYPVQIIADGSNYRSYVQRWEKTCAKHSIPFHYTGKKGAFVAKEK